MTSNFNQLKKLYQDNKFDILLSKKGAVYWLKLRSISRKPLMAEFCDHCSINFKNMKGIELFEYIYRKQLSEKFLDKFIERKYQEERKERKSVETKLISELYKLKIFDWGGLYQNNLERTIVDNYVKKIDNFNLLNQKIESEIHESMRSYVLSSWYNHWTSILIEDIFKDHKKSIPAIGLIKKVDFFIKNIPFDLKVTYFPDGFMQMKRKELGLSTEIQELKKFAHKKNIKYDLQQKDKNIFIELLLRFNESVEPDVKKFWKQFNRKRKQIIRDTIQNPRELIRWLYEKQGERRFDATNRLFLILIDENNLEDSWKMKRNIDLLKNKINNYMDDVDFKNKNRFKTIFDWKDGKQYSAFSDIIFITKK